MNEIAIIAMELFAAAFFGCLTVGAVTTTAAGLVILFRKTKERIGN